MHDCFTIELTGECLKCLFRLTGGVPALVVQSEARWARIPEIQVRIPSRAMGTFFPHTVSSIFRLSLTHTHTHTQHTHTHTHTHTRARVLTHKRMHAKTPQRSAALISINALPSPIKAPSSSHQIRLVSCKAIRPSHGIN